MMSGYLDGCRAGTWNGIVFKLTLHGFDRSTYVPWNNGADYGITMGQDVLCLDWEFQKMHHVLLGRVKELRKAA